MPHPLEVLPKLTIAQKAQIEAPIAKINFRRCLAILAVLAID
jgi:hypothetical protein